jgi:hypothetical protein
MYEFTPRKNHLNVKYLAVKKHLTLSTGINMYTIHKKNIIILPLSKPEIKTETSRCEITLYIIVMQESENNAGIV